MVELKQGIRIGGYELLAFVGKGGMGEIWRSRQASIDREVALKILSTSLVEKNPAFADRFIKEAQAAGRLSHSHIIAVHDVGSADVDGETIHYFSMEFVDGENYREIVERDGSCSIDQVTQIMVALSDALAYAHGLGMIHRDIKPENVMITRDGRVKLADFGLAMQVDNADEVERDASGRIKVMGTPLYMSPEQARGKQLDHRSDQYSLGATLFHLLTGRPPYRKPNSRDVMRAHVHDPVPDPGDFVECPEPWRWLCMKLMAKNPTERFKSTDELKRVVQQIAAGEVPAGMRRRMAGAARRQHGHRSAPPTMGLAIAVGVVLLGGGIAFMAMMSSGPTVTPNSSNNASNVSPSEDDNEPLRVGSGDDSNQLAAVYKFLADLPNDPHAALRKVESRDGLYNPDFRGSEQARKVLEKRREKLEEEVVELDKQQQEQLAQQLDAIEVELDRENHAEARGLLDALPVSLVRHDQGRVASLQRRCNREMDRIFKDVEEDIARASNIARLDKASERIDQLSLDPARLQRLRGAEQRRRREIQREAQSRQAEQRKREATDWQKLVETLHEQRSDSSRQEPDFRDFLSLVERHVDDFKFNNRSEVLAELRLMCQRAQALERNLAPTLRSHPVPLSIRLGGLGELHRGNLVDYDDGRFWWESHDGRTRQPMDLRAPDLELLAVLENVADRNSYEMAHVGAFLWMRSLPNSRAVHGQDIPDHPQSIALSAIDQELREQRLKLNQTYDFRGMGDLDDFQADGLDFQAGRMIWNFPESTPLTQKQIAGQLQPEHLTSVEWTQKLRPPLQIDLKLSINRPTLALIGLRRGDDATWCLLQNTKRQGVGLVLTGDEHMEVKPAVNRVDPQLDRGVDVSLRVDEAGKLAILIDDQPLFPAGHAYERLDGGDQPIELLLQCLRPRGDPGGSVHFHQIQIDGMKAE